MVLCSLGLTGLLLGGTASAHWTAAGVGAGTAATATLTSLTLSPGAPTSELVPGSTADVAVRITNPDPVGVRVGRLSLDTDQGTDGFAVDGAHSGCTLTALHLAPATTGWSVPAHTGPTDGWLDIVLPGALAMATNAASACQGAALTVYLTAAA